MRSKHCMLSADQLGADDIDAMIDYVRATESPKIICELLRAAAATVEHAAYTMARNPGAYPVTRLMLMASELETVALNARDLPAE